MTKGYTMEVNEDINEERTSNLARIVMEDVALKCRTSLQIAEKLLTENGIVMPQQSSVRSQVDLEAREEWSKAMDRKHERLDADEMDIDSEPEDSHSSSHPRNNPTSREEVSYPTRRPASSFIRHPRVFGYNAQRLSSRPRPAYAATRSFVGALHRHRFLRQVAPVPYSPLGWPYYSYMPRSYGAQMLPLHHSLLYPTVNRESQTLSSRDPLSTRIRYCYTPSQGPRISSTATITEPRSWLRETHRQTSVNERRDDDTSTPLDENSPQTAQETEAMEDKNIILTNSRRPSVLVMQSSPNSPPRPSTYEESLEMTTRSPELTSNEHTDLRHERCTCGDDHETTDSDSTGSPPNSPLLNQSAISSDEHFSSDSPRSDGNNKEKPHVCHICSRAFRKHSALIIHHRVHSGEKPYKCSECAKQFSISGNLRRHFLIHTGERPYICPECSRAFNNPSHLTRHRRKLHIKTTTVQQ